MDEQPQVGTRARCAMCGGAIMFVGPYWDHEGELKPRHPAMPVEAKLPQPPPQWMARLDERTQKHIVYARTYAHEFAHGAPGHLDLMTIATLAALLDEREPHEDG